MKKGFIFFVLLVACGFLLSFINTTAGAELGLNAPLPMADEKMKDVSGKEVSLNAAKTSKGLLVIFSCNTCPYVKLSETRIKELSDDCAKQGIGCIIINSNEAQRADEDSFDAMVKYAAAQKLTCAYVVDANSKLADAFGATRTPQCFTPVSSVTNGLRITARLVSRDFIGIPCDCKMSGTLIKWKEPPILSLRME